MRAVVLGGGGFLGRHICTALEAAGVSALPLSRKSVPAVDLTTDSGCAALAAVLSGHRPDLMVNAAGRAWHATESDMVQGNAHLVDRLLDALAGTAHPVRLIHLGSVHEYGPGAAGIPTAEDHTAVPLTPYGRTKLLGTQAVVRAVRTTGVDAVVLRVANAIGPGTPPGSLLRTVADHLAEAAVMHGRGGSPRPLRFGSLDVYRDFVDARDVAEAVVAAGLAPKAGLTGQIVNIGRGEGITARRIVRHMVMLSGLPVPVEEDESAARSGIAWQQLDISKAHRLLSWLPRRELDTSLRDLLGAARPHAHEHQEGIRI
ncbi:NAD-dependent epimerase/dehydratase family protein [Streptomyces sp. NPDC002536]